MARKFYIFDFDGTLVDSMPYWSEKMLSILREFHIPYPDDIIKTLATLGDRGTAEYFRDVMGVPLSVEEMIRRMDDYAMDKYRTVVPLKDGVPDYLRRLKAAGCSVNILTASPHHMVDACLRRLGLLSLFDNVWSTDDFGMTKSNGAIYEAAAQRLGVSVSEPVFFDDNLNAVRTAVGAGMYTVGVYDLSGKDSAEEIRRLADRYVETMAGLELL